MRPRWLKRGRFSFHGMLDRFIYCEATRANGSKAN
jgi:hypothetical protein